LCVTRGATEKRRDGYITCDALYVAGASLLIFFFSSDLRRSLGAFDRGWKGDPDPCTVYPLDSAAPATKNRLRYVRAQCPQWSCRKQ